MDNVTHALVGVALADLAMGSRVPRAQRPLFVGAGIIAANLPDIDLAYAAITPSPLGYLLHHRGHTHTVLGIGVLAIALGAAYWFFPSVRKLRVSGQARFWMLIAIALASHLLLDGLNSYGLHPFSPFDNTWRFGDAVFIFEPWLWVILGIAVAWNGRSRAAMLTAALPMLVLLAAVAWLGIMPLEAVAALAVVGAMFAWVAIRVSPHTRSAAALVICALVVAGLIGTSRIARGATVAALAPELRGRLVDVVLTPNPSSVVCWSAIAVELRERGGEYVLWRGTLSLAPRLKPPSTCPSEQFSGARGAARGVRVIGDGRFVLRDEIHQPLGRLRALAAGNCWVHAWLRFGRAPVISDGAIFDLRFAERVGRNFTQMSLAARRGCPANVPPWAMPRADLLR